jgi:hypothetical protein
MEKRWAYRIKGNSGQSKHLIYFLKFLGNGAEEEVVLKNEEWLKL